MATARIGVATVDLFPRFALTGTLRVAATAAADVFTRASRFWSLGPQVVWPVFTGGRIRPGQHPRPGDVAGGALVHCEQAVLAALRDTETALVKYGQEQARRQALERAVDSSQPSVGKRRPRPMDGPLPLRNQDEATARIQALALRVIAERFEHGEAVMKSFVPSIRSPDPPDRCRDILAGG